MIIGPGFPATVSLITGSPVSVHRSGRVSRMRSSFRAGETSLL